jgi:hypothetical protein
MNDQADTPFETALRRQLRDAAEPDDAGFSLQVMAALPPHAALQHRRWARRLRRARWLAISLAACGAAVLLTDGSTRLDTPHALAGASLVALLVFWAVPSRWSRG